MTQKQAASLQSHPDEDSSEQHLWSSRSQTQSVWFARAALSTATVNCLCKLAVEPWESPKLQLP